MKTTASLVDKPTAQVTQSKRALSALDNHFWTWASIFLLAFLAFALTQDAQLKMWNDEIITLYVARQGGPAEIYSAIKDGMDATPPLYPIIVSAMLPMVRLDALATRLPATLGFTAMLSFVLAFCHRRMPAIYAFAAAFMLVIICGFYATEGRCYGMVLGCAAGALFCWQAASGCQRRLLWLTLLGGFLALDTALHYYSIFLLVPLALVETVRWRQIRSVDSGILVAMLPPCAVLTIHYQLIVAGRRYLPHFWVPGRATWGEIPAFYFQFGLLPAGVILIGFIILAMSAQLPSTATPSLPRYEWLAVGALASMPIAVIIISKYTTHIFVARYALWSVIGLAILAASTLWVSSSGHAILGATVVAAIFVIAAGQLFLGLLRPQTLRQSEAIYRELQHLPNGSEPIVIAYGHAFMELTYYAQPGIRERLLYPLSRDVQREYTGSDLDYLLLSSVRRRTKLRMMDLDQLLSSTTSFILAARPTDYLPKYLLASGYRVTTIETGAGATIYQIQKSGR